MSVEFDTSKIQDRSVVEYEEDGGLFWTPEVRDMSMLCFGLGVPALKDQKTVLVFYRRYLEWCAVRAWEPQYSLKELQKWIGFTTNCSTITDAAFNKKLIAWLEERVDARVSNEEKNLAEG